MVFPISVYCLVYSLYYLYMRVLIRAHDGYDIPAAAVPIPVNRIRGDLSIVSVRWTVVCQHNTSYIVYVHYLCCFMFETTHYQCVFVVDIYYYRRAVFKI